MLDNSPSSSATILFPGLITCTICIKNTVLLRRQKGLVKKGTQATQFETIIDDLLCMTSG